MLVAAAVAQFLAEMSACRAPATARAYRGRLSRFGRNMLDTPLAELTGQQLLDWIAAERRWPDGSDKAPDTIRLTITSVEQWQRWLLERELIAQPLIPKQKKPAGRKREMLPTVEETKLILAQGAADFVAIYRALRMTGARPGELTRATIADIDRREGLIVLEHHKTAEKTGKPRKIAIGHPALADILDAAIGDRTSGPIFLRPQGKPWTVDALSAAYRKARRAAGLPEGLVLYLSRHEHATQLYKSTQDLKAVADALGHANIQTTMRYTRTDADTLKKYQQRFSEGLD